MIRHKTLRHKTLYALPFLLLSMITISLTTACNNSKGKQTREQDVIYIEEIKLLEKYTKEIKTAKDTASIDSLLKVVTTELENLNARHTPDIDLLLTEGQNDTLQYKIEYLLKTRACRRDQLLHPVVTADSTTGQHTVPSHTYHKQN